MHHIRVLKAIRDHHKDLYWNSKNHSAKESMHYHLFWCYDSEINKAKRQLRAKQMKIAAARSTNFALVY